MRPSPCARPGSGLPTWFTIGIAMALTWAIGVAPDLAHAVIIDSGSGDGNVGAPTDFPWWSHVQSRLGGTSTVYMGDGWVLTARHVGMGILLHEGERYAPDPETAVEFGTPSKPADLILFRMDDTRPWPDLPFMEIARRSPQPGDDVLLIGNGRNRGKRLRYGDTRDGEALGWYWGEGTSKRWGTNQVAESVDVVEHSETSTRAFATRFDSAFGGSITPFEGQAAAGDSGGAAFTRRDPADPDSEWVLAGVMFTVHHDDRGPPETAMYGDFTHSADLTAYRSEIIARVRPACFDERDDDGDGLVDHPDDPGCASRFDDDETNDARDANSANSKSEINPLALLAVAILTATVGAGVIRALRMPR